MAESRTRVTGTKITLPTGEEFLIVEIAIDCPVCGELRVPLAGHHLRTIRDGLIELIDLHPELTGSDKEVKGLERLQFGWQPPKGDPTLN